MSKKTIRQKPRRRNQRVSRPASFIQSSYGRRLRVETLEDRRMLAAVSVGNALDVVNAPDVTSISALIADDGGDGISLREAITAANNTAGGDTIDFDTAGVFATAQTITLTSGELAVSDSVTINGPGQDLLTINGNNTSRIFNIDDSDGLLNSLVELRDMTLTGGRAESGVNGVSGPSPTAGTAGESGGAIRNAEDLTISFLTITGNSSGTGGVGGGGPDAGASGGTGGDGGGIFSSNALTVVSSTLSANHAGAGGAGGGAQNSGGTGGAGGGGGGIANTGSLSITGSTLSGNDAGVGGAGGGSGGASGTGGVGGDGGGIASTNNPNFTNSTLSGNNAGTGGNGGDGNNGGAGGNGGNGGGFFSSASLTLDFATVYANGAGTGGVGGAGVSGPNDGPNGLDGSGGGISSVGLAFSNTIVAGSTVGVDVATTGLVGSAFNLVEDGSFTSPNTIAGDPLLGALADNGGPTQTHALLVGSLALDAGNSGATTDQRGFTRPVDFSAIGNAAGGDGSDIGAFEQQTELSSLIVTTTQDVVADDGVTSLREAINFANSLAGANTITFDVSIFTGGAASLIRLGGTELAITDSLTIDGSTGTDIVITADANNDDITLLGTDITDVANNTNTSDNSRVFFIGAGDTTLRGLTLTGGITDTDFEGGGGGIRSNSGGTLTLEQSTVSGNSSSTFDGGGIHASSGNVTLNNSIVSGNGSGDNGGGIRTYSGNVTLTGSTVSGNTSNDYGGGIYTRLGNVTLTSSTVSGNSSSDSGGGIRAVSGDVTLFSSTVSGNSTSGSFSTGGGIDTGSGNVTLTSSIVSGNTSTNGGGIFTTFGTVTLASSTVSGNTSSYSGGGIFKRYGAVTLSNSTVSGNSSGSHGGGIYTYQGAVTLISSTVTGNSAAGVGGGITLDRDGFSSTESLSLVNSIVAGNLANELPSDIFASNTAANDLTASFSLIGTNDATSLAEAQTADGAGNLIGTSANPINPKLGTLADNGGPTQTHALFVDSPALDAGNPGAPGLTTDQRGFTRPVDFSAIGNAAGGDGADIGAFEQQTELSSLIVTTTQDVVADDGVTSLREAINFANSQAGSDTITFDASIFTGGANSLIRLGGTELAISDSLTIDGSTGIDIVITADANNDDITVGGTDITDVANNTNTSDNSRVFFIGAGDTTLRGLTLTGGITDTDFEGGGGGIRSNSGGTLTLEQSTVSGNSSSTFDGGGIHASSGNVTLTSSTVSGNTSDDRGGGIYTRLGNVTLTSSTVSGNTSGGNGGGIFAFAGAMTLTSSTVSGNTSGNDGGGIWSDDSTVLIVNSTVTGNSSGGVGGGIGLFADNYNDDERLTIRNSIVAGNTDNGTAPDFLAPGDPVNDLTVSFSLIGDNAGTTLTEAQVADTNGNLIGSSAGSGIINPLLGPLADNGGPTLPNGAKILTHALLVGSLAIDAGDPNFDPNVFTPPMVNDQRGTGFDRVRLGRVDMGAFELQAPAVVGRSIFYDGSNFDGPAGSGVHNGADDGARDSSKSALLPGNLATFNNYTGYSNGITGAFVDIANLPATPVASDFIFRVGNTATPSTWAILATAPTIAVRAGAGTNGSDRVSLIWPAGTIQDQWLQITVRSDGPNAIVGATDVHYWGNQRGEVGNQSGNTAVNSGDFSAVGANFSGFVTVPVTSAHDVNKDGRVSSGDTSTVSARFTGFTSSLILFTPPVAPPIAAAPPAPLAAALAAPLALRHDDGAVDDRADELLEDLVTDIASSSAEPSLAHDVALASLLDERWTFRKRPAYSPEGPHVSLEVSLEFEEAVLKNLF